MLAAQRAQPPPSEEAVLQQLLAQQTLQSQQEEAYLRTIGQEQRLTAFGVISSGRNLQKIERYTAIEFYAWAALIVGTVVYALTIYFSIRQKYAFMLENLEKATRLQQGAYTASSPWFIAFSFEYPAFAGLRFANRSFPASVVFSYYTVPYSQIIVAQPQYVEALYQQSERFANLSAQQLMCDVVGRPNNIPQCFPQCPGPVNNTWQSYLGSAVGLGGQGAFLGSMIASSGAEGAAEGAAGGPWGLLGGFILGAGVGVFLNWANSRTAQAQCGNNPQCVTLQGQVRTCSG